MFARPRPTPTTRRTLPARLSAAATEPPIRPTPTITNLSQLNSLKGNTDQDGTRPSNLFQCSFQRRQEARIFGFGADRYAQVFGHAIRRHRPDDDALLEQPLKNLGALAYLDADEIAMRRNPGQSEPAKSLRQYRHALLVQQGALLDEFIIEQRGGGGSL